MVLYKTKDELIDVLKKIIFEEDTARYGFVFAHDPDDSRFGKLYIEDSRMGYSRDAICNGYYPEVTEFRDYMRDFISKQQDKLNEVRQDICKECGDIKELYFTLVKGIKDKDV